MQKMKPTMWQYSPSNSPQPLPKSSFLINKTELIPIDLASSKDNQVTIEQLKQICATSKINDKQLSQYLNQISSPDLLHRKPILLLGELANPFQLSRINIGAMPVFTVRISGVCRTYADSLDARMIQPGIHHVTLARCKGWWELTHMALATSEQMKKMVEWLNNNQRATWRLVKPNEGEIMLEHDSTIPSPPASSIHWDGKEETCLDNPPLPSGPKFPISEVIVPVHTKFGCYDNRGKIIRCNHVSQRDFHTNYFRRGSSKKWHEILQIR